jgi:hypothetical protein
MNRGQHTFAEYFAKVGQRGQQTMRAMAAEYPDITLFGYVNPPGSTYYLGCESEPRVARLEANLETAVRAADEYVWIYGEKNRWWPVPPEGRQPATNWTEALPGIELAMLRAKDPIQAARQLLASTQTNLLLNGNFATIADGKPANWWVWQDEKQPAGTLVCEALSDAVRLAGVFDGCFGQNVKVQPGERYAVSAMARQAGHGVASVRVGWKNAAGKWTRSDASLRLTLASAKPREWRELAGSGRVPDGIAELIVTLNAAGQTKDSDYACFKSLRLARFDQ